jgi:AcrR family transcriptional regulator
MSLREQKQRETRLRIAETAMELFLEHGYDGTTLDAIAAAAGISRRTFFSYYKSKEDIVLAWQEAAWQAIWDELLTVSPDQPPLEAVRDLLIKHAARYEADELRATDRVMRSNETLMARKQAAFAMQEEALYRVLCEVWRQPHRRPALRIVAMVALGTLRLAIKEYGEQDGARPASSYLEEAFAQLQAEI